MTEHTYAQSLIVRPQIKTRVIIIGSGLAGFVAGITLCRNRNFSVYMLEKECIIGGNSKKATSGINGCGTSTQKKLQVNDSTEIFNGDTMKSGKGECCSNLVSSLVKQSKDVVELLKSCGCDLSILYQCGGHSSPRTHCCMDGKSNVGGHIISSLFKESKKYPNFKLLLGSKVVRIKRIVRRQGLYPVEKMHVEWKSSVSRDNDSVHDLVGDEVVLAMGGFGRNKTMLKKYSEKDVSDFPATSGRFGTGDWLDLLGSFKPKLCAMKYVQVHPTSLVNPNEPDDSRCFLAPEALRASGGVLLVPPGKRFVNELGLRDDVVAGILENASEFQRFKSPRKVVQMILNEAGATKFGKKKIMFYHRFGFFDIFDDLKQLCKKDKDLDFQTTKETFKMYNNAAKGKNKDDFGKVCFPNEFPTDGKLYRCYVTPAVHYTIGGLKINTRAQILDKDNFPVSNMYAAGECTGGVHGKNRLAGNSLLDCSVFGKIAAESIIASRLSANSPGGVLAVGKEKVSFLKKRFGII